MDGEIRFKLNGETRAVETDGARKLLWVLRADLGLTGTKYGCGEGYCGACTVLLDGKPVRSCRIPVSRVQGREVVTIEGLADGDALHPLQQAFVDHDALQCGFCTPGLIMQAAGFLKEHPDPSPAEIRAALEKNLCRCGSHVRVLRAVQAAARAMKGGAR